MMHDGVADEEDFGDLRLAAGGEARDELAERGADGRGEIAGRRARRGCGS